LAELIRDRYERITAKVITRREEPSACGSALIDSAEIEELKILLALVELRDKGPERRRLFIYGSLVLAVASILMFGRTRTTEVTIESRLSEVTFSLPAEYGVFDSLRLSAVGMRVSGR
jgi:hypothetical protein